VVEQRHALLEAVRHRAQVALSQCVIGQVIRKVDRDQRFERAGGLPSAAPVRGRHGNGRLQRPPLAEREAGKAQRVSVAPIERELVGDARCARLGQSRPRAASDSHASSPARSKVRGIALVAREELVAAVPRQHDLDVPRRLAREHPQRKARGIGERLVEVGDERVEDLRARRRYLDHDVSKPEPQRERRRRLALVVRRAAERGRQRDDVRVPLPREAARDGR
jgi:hypothetical protein